jgi:integration host factor subunit alpha
MTGEAYGLKRIAEMALTKIDIVKSLSRDVGFEIPDAQQFVAFFFAEISKALVNGEHVRLSGFGNFVLHDKKERPARNPKTRESAVVTARRVVSFIAGRKLRQSIQKQYFGE